MKRILKRFIAFSLSICIVFLSVLLCPFSVHAIPSRQWNGEWVDRSLEEVGDELYMVFGYVVTQLKAVVNGDFYSFVTNEEKRKDLIDPETGRLKSWVANSVTVDPETNEMTISEELVAYIKQALIEYADETNPFKIEKTYPVNAIPASTFPDKSAYEAFKSYCARHAYTLANPQGSYMYIGDITPYIKDGGGFVKYGSLILVYSGDWKAVNIPVDYYQFKYNADDGYYVDIKENYGVLASVAHYNPNKTNFKENLQYGFIVTKDGGRIRVFNSASEFMDYNAGQRKVFFGSGFYDFDPSDITVSLDEFFDKIEHMDDILQDIIDAITDNPNISEEDLEKLIDELLGKLGEIGDKTDETNTILGGISSTLDGVASSLSGYFSSVLSALSGLAGMVREGFMMLSEKMDMMIVELGLIYESMGDMTEEEVSEKTDSLLSQLFSAFSEIGDVLKGKFPFCLPNDLYTMLALLAGDEVSVSPGAGGGGGGDGNGDIMICAYGAGADDSNAPVFEIPFVIGSADIEERIIIDLSPFEYISKLSRTLMTLYYCACLMQLTLKVIDLGKELGDD